MEHQVYTQLIRERIRQYGDKNVLMYQPTKERTWKGISWEAMGKTAEKVAKALISYGLSEMSNVAIYSQNMPEWTMTDLGIMFARCVSVPIYASESKDYAKYLINEAEIKIVFVGEQVQYDKTLSLFGKSPTLEKIIAFDESIQLSGNGSMYFSDFIKDTYSSDLDKELNRRLNNGKPEDIVTIIYTSGTTGEPKGVMLDHKNILNAIKIHDERLNFSNKDVSLCFLPLSHIFERFWVYVILHKGITNFYIKNPREVMNIISEVKPTLMCAVPRFFEKTYEGAMALVETSKPLEKKIFHWALDIGFQVSEMNRLNSKIPISLKLKYRIADFLVLKKGRQIFGGKIRFMPCAGAPIADHIVKFFHSAGIFVMCGYGLTETSATVCCFPYHDFDRTSSGSLMPGVQVKIGENDEILIKGDGVTKGYYKKPQVTAESFSNGWFHTGDAGRLINEKHLVVFDRIKDIIKTSSGKYVAPQKVELLLKTDPVFEYVAVIGNKRKYITAIIVPSFPLLEQHAKNMQITWNSYEELVSKKAIIDFFDEKIAHLQSSLANFERIKKFTLLPHSFAIETGELTATLKVKRKIIAEKYSQFIEQMYQEV